MRSLAVILLFAASTAHAVPLTLQHQGRLMDSMGLPLDGSHTLGTTLYDAPAGGAVVWVESAAVAFDNGYYSLVIGDTTGNELEYADFAQDGLWLALAVDGGADLGNRIKMHSVPFAIRANTATDVDGGVVNASVIMVNGTTVIDGSGTISGASDTLLDLGCTAVGSLARYDGTAWTCAPENGHFHDASAIDGGTLSMDRLPTGTGLNNVALGEHQHADLTDVLDLYSPVLYKPDDAAVDLDLASVLQWSGVAGPFLIELDTDPAFGDPYTWTTTLNGSELGKLTKAGLPPVAGTYSWRVTATGYGQTEVSSVRTLTIAEQYGQVAGDPGASCKDILDQGYSTGSGIYWIDPTTVEPVRVYCDMVTQGGGWTLVTWGYDAVAGGTEVYYVPDANQGATDPETRVDRGSIDVRDMVKVSTEVAVTVNNGTGTIDGDITDYGLAYVYAIPSPAATVFNLSDTTSCNSVTVTELGSGSSFGANVQSNKLSVACSGHKGSTPFERQMLGFNSSGCWGMCGADPTNSNGLITWYGNGYDPFGSGGQSDPERAGSFGFWMK